MINVGSVINLEAFETRDRSLERERERELVWKSFTEGSS